MSKTTLYVFLGDSCGLAVSNALRESFFEVFVLYVAEYSEAIPSCNANILTRCKNMTIFSPVKPKVLCSSKSVSNKILQHAAQSAHSVS